jgi:hypothetical protein
MRYYMSTVGGLAALLLFLSGILGEIPGAVNSVRGQTLYVPVYSEIPHGDRDHTLDLTATLSIRNIIKASDRSGGISAGFIVEWESEHLCVPPVVEAVMISTASTQGISFSSQARVVEEKR